MWRGTSRLALLIVLCATSGVRAQPDARVIPRFDAGAETPVTRQESARPTDTNVALHDRLPFLAPGWRPIATAGYRLQLGRQPFDHVDVVDLRPAHGFTAGVLFPLLASGTASSRTRLAFALGAGADFAVGRYEATYPYRAPDGLRFQVPAYGERTTYLYGQVAAVLRAQLGHESRSRRASHGCRGRASCVSEARMCRGL